MKTVNMFEAKSQLSRLVESVENGSETEIVIARNGRPAARIVALPAASAGPRIGVAKGRFRAPENIDEDNDLVANLFQGRP